jgi:hypothetical protein
MDVTDLVVRYPRLFHVAESGSWPSIEQHGLLSTTALLDRFEVTGAERVALEAVRRARSVTLVHGEHGSAVLRDQIPLNPTTLARCLVGMTPGEWYQTLNRRVFFWLTEERLERLLAARGNRGRPHDVLTVDSTSLVTAHESKITLAHLNTGTTVFRAPERGPDTFQSIAAYARRNVVELAVDYSVPDIAAHTLRVESRHGVDVVATLWQR